MALVNGYNLVPEPPAKIIPFMDQPPKLNILLSISLKLSPKYDSYSVRTYTLLISDRALSL